MTIIEEVSLPSEEDKELQELEARIDLLQQERINLRVPPALFDRLLKVAEFKELAIEDYCVEVLRDSLEVAIGKPTITAPSKLSGHAQNKTKVSGPTFSVTRVNGWTNQT